MALLLLREVLRGRAFRAAAREREATFDLLTRHSADVVSRIDAQGRRVYLAPSAEKLFGRAVEEVLAEPMLEQAVPEDRPQVEAALMRLRAGERQVRVTYRIHHPDGRPVWIEASGFPVIDEADGQYDGAVVIARDVTERKLAEEQLTRLARTDALTALANRRHFDETLDGEWRRMQREGAPLSLILLDVDRFKLFNDRYGHPTGDDCLRRIAAAIALHARRPADLAARHGGEEFAVLLPNTPAEGAAGIAERIRGAIEALGLPHDANPPTGVVTVSLGIACAKPAAAGSMAEALVAAADGALYEAKRTGRNRLRLATSVPPPPMPPPVPVEEEARLRALVEFDRAGAMQMGDEELERIARLAAALLGTTIALVSLVGRDRQRFVAAHGLDSAGTSRDASFCAHLLASTEEALVVPDAALDARFAGNPLVTGAPGIRFYAGAPLICPRTGHRLGALCSIDQVPRPPLTPAQQAVLRDLAAMAMGTVERRRAVAEALRA